VHFSDLKADLLRETHRIANFLEIPVRPETWQRISEHCSFEYMKSHVSTFSQHLDSVFVEGAKALINHGKNRKWRDALSAPDLAKYRYAMAANVTSECAHWLRTGET
jgi:aryl sulfotransferase